MPHKVNLVYFRESGKYYTEGEYISEHESISQIWEEVARMQELKRLPGLIEGSVFPIISVEIAGHPHEHPHLVIHWGLGRS